MLLTDIEAVLAIEEQSFPRPAKASGYRYELVENEFAAYQVLTVGGETADQLIGYAGYWLLADELHVSIIATDPRWRGWGLGELLLLNMLFMAYADRARLATLEVRRSNSTAQQLYVKYGFAIVGQRRRYYEKKEDALIMTVEPLDDAYHAFLEKQKEALFQRLAGNEQQPA